MKIRPQSASLLALIAALSTLSTPRADTGSCAGASTNLRHYGSVAEAGSEHIAVGQLWTPQATNNLGTTAVGLAVQLAKSDGTDVLGHGTFSGEL